MVSCVQWISSLGGAATGMTLFVRALCRLWRGHRSGDRSESHSSEGPARCHTTKEASSNGSERSGLLMSRPPNSAYAAVHGSTSSPRTVALKPVRSEHVEGRERIMCRPHQLPLNHRFVFSHGYCPDCVAYFDERMAAYIRRPSGGH